MKVIQFPGTAEVGKLNKVKYVKPEQASNILMGELHFTCPNCTNKATFNISNMIFRLMEFYCTMCGRLHKVVNPAFSPSVKAKDK